MQKPKNKYEYDTEKNRRIETLYSKAKNYGKFTAQSSIGQTNKWRKLHNEELQRLFQRPNIVREIVKRRLN